MTPHIVTSTHHETLKSGRLVYPGQEVSDGEAAENPRLVDRGALTPRQPTEAERKEAAEKEAAEARRAAEKAAAAAKAAKAKEAEEAEAAARKAKTKAPANSTVSKEEQK